MPTRFQLYVTIKRFLADTSTPVRLYLALRDKFPGTLLLEGGDYRGSENSFSYLCFDPIAEIKLEGSRFTSEFPDGTTQTREAVGENSLQRELRAFLTQFEIKEKTQPPRGVVHGLFGYFAYDAIRFIEEIKLRAELCPGEDVPTLRYALFRHVIAINHFTQEMFHVEYKTTPDEKSKFDVSSVFDAPLPRPTHFSVGIERQESNLTDQEHIDIINKCKEHIARGDVFQIVPSRKFSQKFSGDEFNVYRALRSLNPSPYLFYFDYGTYRIFGSSPESQIVVQDGKASIFPIAGTYRRTGNDLEDTEAARRLMDDPKESAEHVMLVDLARNDLSIFCHPVQVERFKEIQLYSHVIHLVSKVSGRVGKGSDGVSVLTATFPAGTLSGAPKYRAMELIDTYEKGRRHFYGGGLGLIGFDGTVNHAIMIRSFLSKDNVLWSQAGSGIVADSIPETEVQEVKTKLAALKAAIALAEM